MLKENSHMGCIILFITVAVVIMLYSIPKLKQQEAQKQKNISAAALERAWEIADSIHRTELMEDDIYIELLEKYENTKSRMNNIRKDVSDAEDALYELERQGADVSELEDILSSIDSECN